MNRMYAFLAILTIFSACSFADKSTDNSRARLSEKSEDTDKKVSYKSRHGSSGMIRTNLQKE